MAVTKRLRYEILRRDNHACRYCGASAPDVKLTVDHVTPTALGGTDEPSNLVTACRDCNAGKSSSSPDAPVVDDVAADALRWSAAVSVATEEMLCARDQAQEYVNQFVNAWEQFDEEWEQLPIDFTQTVESWKRAGLPIDILTDAVFAAWANRYITASRTWRYTYGIVKNRLKEIHSRASELARAGDDGGEHD